MLQGPHVGQRPQEIRRAKGRCQGTRPSSHYKSHGTAGSWDTLQDAGNSHCLPYGAAAGVQGPACNPPGGFWMSGTRACGCLQSGADEAGRAGRAMKGHDPLPAVLGLQEGQVGTHGTGWPGCGRCWSPQGQQPVGGQWLHRVGPRAQAFSRQADQGLSLGPRSRGAVKCPSSPALPDPQASCVSPGLAPASAVGELLAKGRSVFNIQA